MRPSASWAIDSEPRENDSSFSLTQSPFGLEESLLNICLAAIQMCAVRINFARFFLESDYLTSTCCVIPPMIIYTFHWNFWNVRDCSFYETWFSWLWGFMMAIKLRFVVTPISLPWTRAILFQSNFSFVFHLTRSFITERSYLRVHNRGSQIPLFRLFFFWILPSRPILRLNLDSVPFFYEIFCLIIEIGVM